MGSVALAAALTGWLALAAGPDATRPVAGIGGFAVFCLVATLAVGRPEGIVAGLVLLGGAYVVILVIDDPPLDSRSAVVGATLLAIGELAHLSAGALSAVTVEAGTVARRVGFIAVLAMVALGLGATLLAVVDLLRTGGLAVEVIGVAAAAGAIGLLVLAARTAREGSTPPTGSPRARVPGRDVWDDGSSQGTVNPGVRIGNPLARIPGQDDR